MLVADWKINGPTATPTNSGKWPYTFERKKERDLLHPSIITPLNSPFLISLQLMSPFFYFYFLKFIDITKSKFNFNYAKGLRVLTFLIRNQDKPLAVTQSTIADTLALPFHVLLILQYKFFIFNFNLLNCEILIFFWKNLK